MNTKKTVVGLLILGMVIGIAGVAGFNATMSYTNTDAFCLSCHNHDIPYRELQQTVHFANASGVTPGCADCHVPTNFADKVVRKLEASKEVYGHLTGVIDTEEKYLAHREEMKTREIARLREWDSSTCRTCHNPATMDHSAQSATARYQHLNKSDGKTCIDCHQGIAHTPAVGEDDLDF